jgi:hypothetical protein
MPTKLEIYNRFMNLYLRYCPLIDEYYLFRCSSSDFSVSFNIKMLESFVCSAYSCGAITFDDAIEKYSMPAKKLIKPYSPMNVFATFRIYGRKIDQLQRRNREYHSEIRQSLKELRQIDIDLQAKSLGRVEAERYQIIPHMRDQLLSLAKFKIEKCPFFIKLIPSMFSEGWRMSKNDFFSIITINKDSWSWDKERVASYQEWCNKVPDLIDFETFEGLIFIERIEHDRDCPFWDLFMEHMLKVMEENREQFNAFDVFEKVTGKPIQTYTAHTDDYGVITSMVLNKPELKIVH